MGGRVGGMGLLNDQKQQTLEGRHSWISVGWDGEVGQSPRTSVER